jgi:hypothetical protein
LVNSSPVTYVVNINLEKNHTNFTLLHKRLNDIPLIEFADRLFYW